MRTTYCVHYQDGVTLYTTDALQAERASRSGARVTAATRGESQ